MTKTEMERPPRDTLTRGYRLMQTQRKDLNAFGSTHFTIQVDKPIDDIGEGDEELEEAYDTKKRFLYRWNCEHQGRDGDELYLEIKDRDGKSISGMERYRKGGWKIENYLENCEW